MLQQSKLALGTAGGATAKGDEEVEQKEEEDEEGANATTSRNELSFCGTPMLLPPHPPAAGRGEMSIGRGEHTAFIATGRCGTMLPEIEDEGPCGGGCGGSSCCC